MLSFLYVPSFVLSVDYFKGAWPVNRFRRERSVFVYSCRGYDFSFVPNDHHGSSSNMNLTKKMGGDTFLGLEPCCRLRSSLRSPTYAGRQANGHLCVYNCLRWANYDASCGTLLFQVTWRWIARNPSANRTSVVPEHRFASAVSLSTRITNSASVASPLALYGLG